MNEKRSLEIDLDAFCALQIRQVEWMARQNGGLLNGGTDYKTVIGALVGIVPLDKAQRIAAGYVGAIYYFMEKNGDNY